MTESLFCVFEGVYVLNETRAFCRKLNQINYLSSKLSLLDEPVSFSVLNV